MNTTQNANRTNTIYVTINYRLGTLRILWDIWIKYLLLNGLFICHFMYIYNYILFILYPCTNVYSEYILSKTLAGPYIIGSNENEMYHILNYNQN